MKLGELFVDLGVNSGGAFNALSSFAFKLGNIANLGETVTRYVDSFFGEAPKWASNMRMLSRNVDLTTQELQDLEEASAVLGIDLNTAIGFYKRLWGEFYTAASTGFDDKGYLEKWSKFFGPEVISELTTNIRTPIELIELLNNSLEQIENKADLMAIREAFGMTAELQQAFKLFSYGGVGIINLTDRQIKNLNILRETKERLRLEDERQHAIWLSKIAPMFTDWLEKLYNLKKGYYEATQSATGLFDLIYKTADYSFKKAFFIEDIDRLAVKISEDLLGVKLSEEGKRKRNEEWIKQYGHPYEQGYEPNGVKSENKNLGVSSGIDLERTVLGKSLGNNVYAPVFNTTVNTDVGSVGRVIDQTTQSAINGARNGNMELMLGRGYVND